MYSNANRNANVYNKINELYIEMEASTFTGARMCVSVCFDLRLANFVIGRQEVRATGCP